MTDTTATPHPSRGRTLATRLVVVAAIVAVISLIVAAVRTTDSSSSGSGCAIMSDSIGLYPGSNLTLLGVTIGHVTKVAPDNGAVRVDFDVDGGVRFPANVSAVTTSDSIVTDRRLEIPTPYVGGPTWDTARCIPLDRTRTPKSLSQSFDAFDKLSSQLTDVAGRSPEQQQAVGNALADAGFDATKPTARIAEGLLGYLPPDAQDRLLDQIGELSPAGSRLAAEGVPSHHEVDQEELREKMKDSTDRWRDHGFDLDFSELVFLGDRSELTGYLKGHGWTVDAAPTNELLIRYGLEPLDDGEGFADVVYVTATT